MLKKVAYTLMPIRRDEIKKCISMGMMFFFILFNYDVLRPLKDSMIVPNIGAEAVSFIKMYAVTPAALLLMILYTYLSERLNFEKIFYYFALFFLVFFLLFGLVLYPNQDFFHPNPDIINQLTHSKVNLFFFEINLDHFKWFLKIYGKWTFVLYYVIAELWGSAMIFLLFWQFANHTTKTGEAARLYPMYALIGHIGALLAGITVTFFSSMENSITNCMLAVSLGVVLTLILFVYNTRTTQGTHVRITISKEAEELKSKLTLMQSFKIIFFSKYLRLIVILILSYGTCLNLIEGVWRMRAGQLYADTISYSHFMGKVITYTAICALVGLLFSGVALRTLGWLFGTLVLPVMMLITGVVFFAFSLFGEFLSPYVVTYGINILLVIVIIGTTQHILTKGFKYSFFDITKEMAFIPAGKHLRSKGKAAVDIVGARWAKSIGALIQSVLFMIFPFATYHSLTPYFMVIYIAVILIWIFNITKLNVAYAHKVQEHEHAHHHH